MNVVILSDLDTYGGAAIATSRLATALSQAGHHITRLINYGKGGDYPWKTRYLRATRRPCLTYKIVARLLPSRAVERWDREALRAQLPGQLDAMLGSLRPDAINVHNLHGGPEAGWSMDLIEICVNHAPTVWTLHDMWGFTGRCTYSDDCRKFLTGCDSKCPTPNEYPALEPDRISQAWEGRRRLFAACPQLAAVTPSRWLAKEAHAGLWRGHRIEVIPNSLPLDVYRPVGRELARAALGIEAQGPVLLAVAQNLDLRRKGASVLLQALQTLSCRPVTVLTLGEGRLPMQDHGVYVRSLGHIDHQRTVVLAYSAADLFVHPATADNLPNVVMEAIACGVPVVGFPVGGVRDMVRPNLTGWLAEDISPASLTEAICRAIRELPTRDWRASCRAVAEAEYGPELQAKRYVGLFASMGATETLSC